MLHFPCSAMQERLFQLEEALVRQQRSLIPTPHPHSSSHPKPCWGWVTLRRTKASSKRCWGLEHREVQGKRPQQRSWGSGLVVLRVNHTAISSASHAGGLGGSAGASLTFLHCLSLLRQGSLGACWHHAHPRSTQGPIRCCSSPTEGCQQLSSTW